MGGKIEDFEDLEVWQEGMRLTADIHKRLKNCRDFSLRDQICRSSVSNPSNIAERFERQTNKEFFFCFTFRRDHQESPRLKFTSQWN